jgi:hypothetical protein
MVRPGRMRNGDVDNIDQDGAEDVEGQPDGRPVRSQVIYPAACQSIKLGHAMTATGPAYDCGFRFLSRVDCAAA